MILLQKIVAVQVCNWHSSCTPVAKMKQKLQILM